ncbi:MAG: hypothetical protein JW809_12655 [Pirellulales bacterium]|nr:hypothetical protein [Pirellulales bacterium]
MPNQPVDWNRLWRDERPAGRAVDLRVRLRWCVVLFIVLLGVVFGRAVRLQVVHGEAYRREAARPILERESLPGVRGRILARDGTVLAQDKPIQSIALRYRYLESPPDARWLRSMARSRMSRRERADPRRVAAEETRVRIECQDLGRRLAELCGVPWTEWSRRAAAIQARVERIADDVHRRRRTALAPRQRRGLRAWIDQLLGPGDAPGAQDDTIREELDYHVVVEDVAPDVVARIEDHPDYYPGARIIRHARRDYPGNTLAAHVLGHLGPLEAKELDGPGGDGYEKSDLCGRMGLERQYERLLHGRRGERCERLNHSGRILAVDRIHPPGVGRDLILTLDVRLQREAETLLDRALVRRKMLGLEPEEAGGAIVVMDVNTGAILVAASAPRFDPGAFVAEERDEAARALADPGKPLFDRCWRMAIPPGSVFKTLAAVALLESGRVDPEAPFDCQGYYKTPNALRCEIFRDTGRGHGRVTLADALGQSCNVYFFHHAAVLGAGPLVDWAKRFGFGSPTGVDLPGEAAGTLPAPDDPARKERSWATVDTQMLAIGQGELTATPLQIARMMAAVANGGKLVAPHVVERLGPPTRAGGLPAAADVEDSEDKSAFVAPAPPRAILGLSAATLEAVRRGLRQTVESPLGTAHATVFLDVVGVAGKTGTAQTDGGKADHAWFAGYVPAERPRFVLVVVLEHSGGGGEMAGPVARRLVERMIELGLMW